MRFQKLSTPLTHTLRYYQHRTSLYGRGKGVGLFLFSLYLNRLILHLQRELSRLEYPVALGIYK